MIRHTWLLGLLSILLLVGGCADAGASAVDWPAVEQTHKPWTRWWRMGHAVDEGTLTRLLTRYDETRLGGVEITPIYGVRGYEDQFIDYLSPEWMGLLHHTVQIADSLGEVGVDMATGTGWPFGEPTISLDDAARRVMRECEWSTGLDSPFRQPGENVLEIEVTNLAANRIADLDRRDVQWETFYDINFVGIDYQPFGASTWSPMPSGLLGPVSLTPGTEIQPNESP